MRRVGGAIRTRGGSSSTRTRQRTPKLRILIHETVHALGVGYAEYGRQRAEVIVDAATAIACGSVGLEVDGDSIPYIAGWGETGELDAVTAFAKTIDALARRIENVLAAAETAVESVAA